MVHVVGSLVLPSTSSPPPIHVIESVASGLLDHLGILAKAFDVTLMILLIDVPTSGFEGAGVGCLVSDFKSNTSLIIM